MCRVLVVLIGLLGQLGLEIWARRVLRESRTGLGEQLLSKVNLVCSVCNGFFVHFDVQGPRNRGHGHWHDGLANVHRGGLYLGASH